MPCLQLRQQNCGTVPVHSNLLLKFETHHEHSAHPIPSRLKRQSPKQNFLNAPFPSMSQLFGTNCLHKPGTASQLILSEHISKQIYFDRHMILFYPSFIKKLLFYMKFFSCCCGRIYLRFKRL